MAVAIVHFLCGCLRVDAIYNCLSFVRTLARLQIRYKFIVILETRQLELSQLCIVFADSCSMGLRMTIFFLLEPHAVPR